mmetsp:Transcript_4820/g.8412  ORF Transcript_4820/g.8412 Transcript_4820/m.8412 type:complete len:316 (-) Transcript_4820:190-1137(-)|eukprot:CAMPEP_0182441560 /NCGR_PEP_ID=MMETSP1172-20130603/531_1 /TAXON_ID=708627 /ORGANISM="Timspurckia oligopyrenoides, Strain CCMP3278" /LENGTH=315 /DNA_ID=CAMNT_0024635917 /DNA_START=43 /DNA_END=987 /DNA_ORIENTATION=-
MSSGGSLKEVGEASVKWLSEGVGRGPIDRHEALALLVHAFLVRHGFRPASVSVEDARESLNTPKQPVLPESWSHAGYGGMYKHFRSALTFEIRAIPLGSKVIVHGAFLEDDRNTLSLELNVQRYTNDSQTSNLSDYHTIYCNIEELASLVQINLAHKLVPDSTKDGYTEATNETQTASSTQPRRRRELSIPDYDDDPLRVGPPMRGYPSRPMYPSVGVGDDDLIPGGLPRMIVPPGLGAPPGGGNLMGPNHPAFGDDRGFGLRGPSGGIGGPRLPRGAVPPGARFDPFGPPGFPGNFNPDNDLEPPGPPPSDMYW